MDKKYKLEIPRAQFDRIGDAFELEDHYVNGYNPKTDTVIFTVTEKQRKYFAKFAKKQNNPDIPKKIKRHLLDYANVLIKKYSKL